MPRRTTSKDSKRGASENFSVSRSSAGACLRKSEAGKEGVSHGGILTAKAEVVKQRRKRATDDRKVGPLLKGTVRSDSVPVSEASSGWFRSTFLGMDYWLWERHTSRRERERSFIHTARRILYERMGTESSMGWHPEYIFVSICRD